MDLEIERVAEALRLRVVARTEMAGATVSRFWQPNRLDPSGPAFETAVVRGDSVWILQRYDTEAQAQAGHTLWAAFYVPA